MELPSHLQHDNPDSYTSPAFGLEIGTELGKDYPVWVNVSIDHRRQTPLQIHSIIPEHWELEGVGPVNHTNEFVVKAVLEKLAKNIIKTRDTLIPDVRVDVFVQSRVGEYNKVKTVAEWVEASTLNQEFWETLWEECGDVQQITIVRSPQRE